MYYKLVGREVVLTNKLERRIPHVARTALPDNYVVSTVFLSLDHGHWGNGPPMVFETMLFKGDDSDLWMDRCSTYDEAVQMHIKGVHAAACHAAITPGSEPMSTKPDVDAIREHGAHSVRSRNVGAKTITLVSHMHEHSVAVWRDLTMINIFKFATLEEAERMFNNDALILMPEEFE